MPWCQPGAVPASVLDRWPLPCCRANSHYPDYQADTLFHGLSELVAGQNVVDVPKRE